MTRGISSGATTAVGLPVTLPGYFVEILFSTPARFSSRGTLVWNGATWTAWDVRVRGLGIDGATSTQTGTLTLGNTDLTLSALVLGEGIADRGINVWKFYGDAPGATDPVQVFGGVGASAHCDADSGVVQISVRPPAGITLYSPRMYITQESGWSILPPDGMVINWGDQVLRLTREGF